MATTALRSWKSTMAPHEIKINLPGFLKMLGSNIYAESRRSHPNFSKN
jgi:hypothetical protein